MNRILHVPRQAKWIDRITKRFNIIHNWDGTFSSRLGRGHKIQCGRNHEFIGFVFEAA